MDALACTTWTHEGSGHGPGWGRSATRGASNRGCKPRTRRSSRRQRGSHRHVRGNRHRLGNRRVRAWRGEWRGSRCRTRRRSRPGRRRGRGSGADPWVCRRSCGRTAGWLPARIPARLQARVPAGEGQGQGGQVMRCPSILTTASVTVVAAVAVGAGGYAIGASGAPSNSDAVREAAAARARAGVVAEWRAFRIARQAGRRHGVVVGRRLGPPCRCPPRRSGREGGRPAAPGRGEGSGCRRGCRSRCDDAVLRSRSGRSWPTARRLLRGLRGLLLGAPRRARGHAPPDRPSFAQRTATGSVLER